MRKLFSLVVIISLVLAVLPASALDSSPRKSREQSINEDLKSNDTLKDLTIEITPDNVSHNFKLHVVFVGYDQDVVDTSLIDVNINRYYELPYWDVYLQYTFETEYIFANASYLDSLKGFILQHSVVGTGITSRLNETALQYQKETQTLMPIFLPQSGMAIDARAVEQWFADNPYDSSYADANGYTFYVLNFTEFDSPDQSWEHWYNFSRYDIEAKSINNYWQPLNPDVKFPYPAFTSTYRLLFVDPSAFQWYLKWSWIWYGLDNYLVGPKYAYYYQDLDSFLASHDVSTTEGRSMLAQYLAGWIDDFLHNLISPVAWPKTEDTLSLQILVLNNVSQYGYTDEKIGWILNSTLIEEAVKQLAPYMKVEVSTRFENLSSYPEIEEVLAVNLIEEKNGWRSYDGYQLFYDLLSIRDQLFNMKAAGITVDAFAFLLKNASMKAGPGGMDITGLGGIQQVLILKSIDRYFHADGVTPKSGLVRTMIHELGHNLGIPHTFSSMLYAGDFADDVMGYYSYSYHFCKMFTDVFRRTVVDMKLLELEKSLRVDASLHWPWPRKTLFFRSYLLNIIQSMIDRAMQMYNLMDYLASYYIITEAESLEAYFREIVTEMRVPGDIDGDCKCHVIDVQALLKAYGSAPSSPNWNPEADLNKDGIINFEDCRILKSFFGKKTKVTVGFFTWRTESRSAIINFGAFIFPEWDMPYTKFNISYGLWNWDKATRSCLMRISDLTLSNLIRSVTVKIYNETMTVAEVIWTRDSVTPTDWVTVSLDPSTKYSITVEIQGTMEAFYEMTVVTLEGKQVPPFKSIKNC